MKEKRILVAVGAVAAVLAACSSNVDGGAGPGAQPGGGNSPGAAGGSTVPGAGGGGSSVPGAGGTGAGAGTCVPGVPPTSQIPRMLNRQYDLVVKDLLGVTAVGANAQPPSGSLYADFTGAMSPDAWRIYQDVGNQIAHDVMTGPNKTKFITCDPAATDCLKNTITAFGRKAFRRPLTDDEVARFMKLGQTTPPGAPADVAETTLAAFLVSPSFLLIPELSQTADPSGMGVQLSKYEIASRLSFLLWGSVPDDALNAAADGDMLQTKAQILAQATRMIAMRDKTGPLISSFHRDWAQMNNANAHWYKAPKDATKYPMFTATSYNSFSAELDNFFQEIAYSGGSFKDLFLSNVAFVNQDNAAIYGLDPSGYTADLKKVTLDADQRPGFLTRAGFLASYAHSTTTSPILRGAFMSINILGVNPGPPLDGAAQQTVDGVFMTQRAYVDALTSKAECKGCHIAIINPEGYVFENYDAVGKWQTVDPLGGAIDATASVTFSTGNTKQITSVKQMMTEIANTPNTKQMYATQFVAYGFGRPANANDQCIVDQLNTNLAKSDYTVLNLLADLTQADSFRVRVQATP
ncbi:MAG: DUF1592 domain-containing protein [Pseudomonadota bacterium]